MLFLIVRENFLGPNYTFFMSKNVQIDVVAKNIFFWNIILVIFVPAPS